MEKRLFIVHPSLYIPFDSKNEPTLKMTFVWTKDGFPNVGLYVLLKDKPFKNRIHRFMEPLVHYVL